MRFVILRAQFSTNLGGTLLAICHFESSVFHKLKGDTACDLSFESSVFHKLKGDTACDLSLWKLSFPQTQGGHCLRFVILEARFSTNLRGTLLAICHFGRSAFQKLRGDIACDLSF